MRTLNPNDRVLVICLSVVAGMIGLAYASVPLYRLFCQVTGFGGTPQMASAASTVVVDREIEIRFDANVGQGLPWEFRPERVSMTVHLGENSLTNYRARNLGSAAVAGTATFNVTPVKAGQYFNKVHCFCFTRQELKAGQAMDMGVAFFVDPAIAEDPETKDVRTITLSYTFLPDKTETKTASN